MGGGAESGREESGLMSLHPGIVARLAEGGPWVKFSYQSGKSDKFGEGTGAGLSGSIKRWSSLRTLPTR